MMITLCICTYNRSESLRQTLNSVRRMRGLEALAEILIVDNNSADATPEIAEAFASELPIRHVLERSQGLSHARNRAIGEFKGDLVIFTDDDVLLGANWLFAYASGLSKFPTAQYFGGRILPRWANKPPRWLGEEPLSLLDGVLGWYDHGTEIRPYVCDEELPFGASFGVRRSLLEAMSGFRGDLGCKSGSRGRGEETEFLQRCRAAGALGLYVGRAVCWHAVDPKRLTLRSLFRYGIESGKAHCRIHDRTEVGSNMAAVSHLARGLFQLAKGRGDRFRQCVINAGIQVGCRAHTGQSCSAMD